MKFVGEESRLKFNKYFMNQEYPSKLIEQAVEEISKLPGIGKRTAIRLVLHLLKRPESQSEQLAESIKRLRLQTKFCKNCHMIADEDICGICASPKRDQTLICVVEDIRDVMAIENTGQFQGVYHILGGIISPVNGISPDDLTIVHLLERIKTNEVKEIVFALSTTMEGDTTAYYLSKKLKDENLIISTIARGIPIGGDLEYADEITLGRSILKRTSYE